MWTTRAGLLHCAEERWGSGGDAFVCAGRSRVRAATHEACCDGVAAVGGDVAGDDRDDCGVAGLDNWSENIVPQRSAGLLMYRGRGEGLEVFLVHPGGPFFAKKDLGAWGIPKGEYQDGEEPLQAAIREFQEETGFAVSKDFIGLGWIKQAGGKIVTAWGFEGDCDPSKLVSSSCEVEWPTRSGRRIEIPEVDRGEWFSIAEARERIKSTQEPFLDRILLALGFADSAD